MENTMIPFAVVTWRHANAGGESLVFHYTPGQPFAVVTGPTPWGSGSWGPFPASAVLSVRPSTATDSWPVSGCPSQRWTLADLHRSLVRASFDRITPDIRIQQIAAILAERKCECARKGDRVVGYRSKATPDVVTHPVCGGVIE